MFDGITYRDAERKEQHLRNDEKRCAKEDITDGPSVVKRAEDKNKLGDNVDGGAYYRPEDVHDPQGYGFSVIEASDLLECCNRDEESKCEYYQTGYSEELIVDDETGGISLVDNQYAPIMIMVCHLLQIGSRRSR